MEKVRGEVQKSCGRRQVGTVGWRQGWVVGKVGTVDDGGDGGHRGGDGLMLFG